MPHTVLIHLHNEDPVVGEIEELPTPTDTMLRVMNPRKRDGKDLHYLQNDVTTVFWPWTRISFVELLPSGGEDEIIGFVRE
ncbi:MAG: hypothetical protein KIT70_00770 [Anaerolineales bacterium]|nr:MAG: hypothetical protein KIT70_00770 [Anaerolineales bacterium]